MGNDTKTQQKMLLADDSSSERKDYKKMILEALDIQIDEVNGGGELVKKAREGGYVVIVTDYDMKYGDLGTDAIKRIREFDRTTPIILHTGGFIAPDMLDAGANHVLHKRSRNYMELTSLVTEYARKADDVRHE